MINYDINKDKLFQTVTKLFEEDIKENPERAKFYEETRLRVKLEMEAEKRIWDAEIVEAFKLCDELEAAEEEAMQDDIPVKVLEELEKINREVQEETDKNLVDFMEYLERKKAFEELVIEGKKRGLKKPPFKHVNEAAAYIASKKDNIIEVQFNNNTVKLNLDTTPFKHKPIGKEAGGVQNRLNKNIKEISIKDLAAAVALNGNSFKAAQIAGSLNTDWIGQDIFALDIDNGDYKEYLEGKRKKEDIRYPYLTMKEAYDRCIKYNIKPAFMYPSFSNTPEVNKFRIVFRVPTTVTDLRVRKVILNALINIFPERDIACKDLTRIFFGGCQQIYNLDEDAVLEPVELIQSMISYIKDTDAAHAARKIKNFCAETGLNTINSMPYVVYKDSLCGENTLTSIYNYRGEHELTTFVFNIEKIEYKDVDRSNRKYKNINYKENFKEELIQRFNFDELESKCELWQEFINGSRWCFHDEIFGIASNMWRVKGAEKRMIEAIESNSEYKDTYNKTNTVKSMRKYGYSPQRCENFCPYYNSCNCNCNMLTLVNNKRGNIRRVENVEPKKLKDAEKELDTIIRLSLSTNINTIDIIAAPTGIGKTTAIGNLKEYLKNSIFAYPNHKLGEDIIERLGLEENEYLHLKDLDLKDKDALKEFRRLQSLGAYGLANNYLENYKNKLWGKSKVATGIEKDELLAEIDKISVYENTKEEARTTNKIIFCTHAKALTLKNNNINKFIFDEDVFLSSCFSTTEIILNDLSVAINASKYVNENGSTYKQLLKLNERVNAALATPNTIINVPTFNIDDGEITEIIKHNHHLKVNIKELLKLKILISDIKGKAVGAYIKELPNKKCIVLSATANKTIYEAAFKDRKVNFFDLGIIEQEGQVVLHYQSYSKQALINNFDNLVEKIREEAPGINNIISYKPFNEKLQDRGFNTIAHFGACAGIDAYKGQDLIVAGTPRTDSRIYPLLANLLRPGTTTVENNQENVNVINNGWEFSIFTYDEGNGTTSGLLQQIQFYLIELEIAQAVGRARTLRTNATVHLFSNYPLRECILYKDSKKATKDIAA